VRLVKRYVDDSIILKEILILQRKTLISLSAFVKLRNVTNSFEMSLRPSVRMKKVGSQWTDFLEI